MTIMLTFSGLRIDLQDPKPEQISLVDIAHHLSNICRFTGAVTRFYSVAQHSVLVSRIAPPELCLPALLHDAHEAYIGDLGTPLKQAIACEAYRELRRRFDRAIGERFGFHPECLTDPEVKRADLVALATERRDLMPPDGDDIWPMLAGVEPHHEEIWAKEPAQAKANFVAYFKALAA